MRTLNLISVALNAIWAGTGLRNKMRVCLSFLVLACALTSTQMANAQITVNGNPSDWPTALTNPAIPFKTFVTDPFNVSDDDQFTTGSSDEDLISGWGWNYGNVNDKTDMNHAAMLLIGHKLYFMGDRYSNDGDASIGIWVLKNNVMMLDDGTFSNTHAIGDVLITSTFTNGGGHPERHVYKWTATGLTEVILSLAAADVAVNTGTIAAPVAWGYTPKSGAGANEYPENAFFEGFVDLDSMGVDVDICFTEFFMSTRNSQSTSASLQDLVRGLFATRPLVSVANDTVCAGQPAVFTAIVTGGLAPITYSWNGGSYAAANTYTINPATVNTVVTVRAQGDNGCISEPDTAQLVVRPAPNVVAHGDVSYCPNVLADAINFSSGVGGTTFTWTASTDVGFGTSGSSNIPAYLTTGGFVTIVATVIVTPTANGCPGAADTFLVTVNPTPGPNAPVGNDSLCNGATAAPIDLTGLDPTVTTHWVATTDVGFGTSGDGDIPSFIGTNGTAAPLTTTVTVTSSSAAGCPSGDTTGFVVTVYPDPNANAPVDNIFLCSGASADSINIKGLDEVTTFSWTSTVDVGFGTSGTGNIPPYVAVNNPGPGNIVATVTVTGMSPNGCPGDTTGFTVTIYPNPTTVARDTAICLGISIDLASLGVPPGGTWTGDGLTGSMFNVGGALPADVYGVLYTYTDINGCHNSDSAYITLNALPTVLAGDTALCLGVSIDLTSLGVPSGGTWSGTGVSGNMFNDGGALAAGAYTVTYTYEAGSTCINSDDAVITINALPTVVARDTAICAGVALNLVPLGTPAGGTWSGTGVSGDMFNNDGLQGAGVYTLTYTYMDGNGCTNNDNANITINALPTVVARDTSICASIVLDLNLLSDPDGGTWSGTGASGTTFNGAALSLGAHGLKYTYTTGAGCSASDSAYITLTSCGNVFGTFTQGFWGSTNGKHCDGAGNNLKAVQIIANALASGQIVIGRSGRSVIIPVGAAAIVNAVMPGGKTPDKLKVGSDVTISNTPGSTFFANYLTGGRINNVFLSQVIAIKLAVRMNAGIGGFPIEYNPGGASWFQVQNTTSTNCIDFAPVACSADSFSFKYAVTRYLTKGGTQPATLADLINLADDLLGGVLTPGTTVGGYVVPSYADVSGAIDMMNNAFDNWGFFTGSYGTNLNAGCYGAKPGRGATTPSEDVVTLERQTHIYPNPTSGAFTIEVPAIDKEAHVTVVDLNGRTILNVVLPASSYGQRIPVELPAFAHGFYFVRVESDGTIFTKKVMVE